MKRLRGVRITAVLVLLAFAGAGCAARWAYRQGQDAAEKGDWDLAVARLTRALDKDHGNIRYKITLENARVQASRFHYDESRKHLAANDLAKAAEELEIASRYDPANRSAADDLLIVRRRIEKQAEEQRQREQLDQVKARARAAKPVVPTLSPSSNVSIPMMQFESRNVKDVYQALAKLAGVNVLFDETIRDDRKTSVVLRDLTFQQALDRISLVNKFFYKVIDQNTIIVVPDNLQNRRKYDELLLRTFYLQNAVTTEVDETANMIKSLARIQASVVANKSLSAITVVGTADQVAIAERVVAANDKARGEVVCEVQILEASRTAVRDWGLRLSAYGASATLSPTGSTNEADPKTGLLTLRGYLLSSLNQADWMVSIPSTLFAQFLQSNSTVRILASPRLRAAEGKKADLSIGEEIPIPMTSFGLGAGGQTGTGFFPATQIQYKNVGVTLSLTPRVSAGGDVTIEVTAEFSILGTPQNVGTKAEEQFVPSFLTRKVNSMVRLRDGETGLIGGLLQGRDARSFAGTFGMNSIPVLGKLLGARKAESSETEILMSITPRIVRAPKLTEEDFVPLSVGTQEVPRVDDARRPFGPPEAGAPESPAAQRGTSSGPSSAPPASSRTAPQPLASPAPPAPPGSAGAGSAGAEVVPTPAPGTTGATGTPAVPPAEPAPGPPSLDEPETAPPSSASASAAPGRAATPAPRPTPPSPGAGAATAMLSPSEVSLRVGQSAGLAVVIVGGKDVQSVEMTLVYDPRLVEVTDAAAGALLTLDGSPVQTERTAAPGRVRIRFARATPVSGSGQVLALTLRGAQAGASPITVESLRIGRPDGTSETPQPPAAGRLVVAP